MSTNINQRTTVNLTRTDTTKYEKFYGEQYLTGFHDSVQTYNASFDIISQVRAGTTTTNYYKLLRQGNLPQNQFLYTETSYTPFVGQYKQVQNVKAGDIYAYRMTYTRTGLVDLFQRSVGQQALPSSIVISNLRDQAIQRAKSKLKDQDVNLLEVWGERHETINMIGQNIDRIGRAASKLRQRDLAGAAQALGVGLRSSRSLGGFSQSKALSNGWLELQYGWRPLISDIYGGVEFLHKKFTKPKVTTVRVVGHASLDGGDTTQSTFGTLNKGRVTISSQYHVDVKACAYYHHVSPTSHTLAQLGITNPLYLWWELTRFSFVVDWLIGIGSWLSSIDAAVGFNYNNGCITTFQRGQQSWNYSLHGQTTPELFEDIEYSDEGTFVSCQRAGLSNFETYLTLPAFKDPSSLEHALNAVALLRQSFKR